MTRKTLLAAMAALSLAGIGPQGAWAQPAPARPQAAPARPADPGRNVFLPIAVIAVVVLAIGAHHHR